MSGDVSLLGVNQLIDVWKSVAFALASVQMSTKAGHSWLIKVDGQRESGDVYTVLVEPKVGPPQFRSDGASLSDLLNDALTRIGYDLLSPQSAATEWESASERLAWLDRWARSGAIFLLQIDGNDRFGGLFEVVLSDLPATQGYFREAADALSPLLAQACVFAEEKSPL